MQETHPDNQRTQHVDSDGAGRVMRFLSGRLTFLCIALFVSTATFAQAGNFYCCKDESGRQVCGDFVPAVCTSRGYRVVNQAGVTVREIAAPLTAEQKAQKAAEAKRLKEEKIAQDEKDRKAQILLDTYPSVANIDATLKRDEDEIQRISNVSKQQIANLKVQQKVLLEEAEFYKNQELPAKLSTKLRDLERQINDQEIIIKAQEKTLTATRTKYADEKRRYLEIVNQRKQQQP